MTTDNTAQPRPHSPRLAPLQHPPRRIRPPFDTSHDTAGDQNDQTTQPPDRGHADRVTALLEPLDGIELGAYDLRILEWLADWDTPTIGTIASLLYRARAIDHDAGAGGGGQAEARDGADGGVR
jgi:hypothetical protein